ncbi:hypothetical protein [Chroococcidiopsis sp. CCNUC1]|uniref:hypothetical protein n=1 Tax=Chroococcidiopsis sp. CCNUC1 TaxID=2653189 RepID=UPI002021CC22|nr:hypothetical protein [Chroococcidiopsis sp. CCNUC1]URD50732.1 hypothetical protein M5J74_01805 [Chroococcidiopsis sp. CCNUC1]
MESLVVITHVDGTLVVDSRLIAQELGIEHSSLMKTIYNYQYQIEVTFGAVRFEIEQGKPLPQGGFAQSAKFCYLTEDKTTIGINAESGNATEVEIPYNQVLINESGLYSLIFSSKDSWS